MVKRSNSDTKTVDKLAKSDVNKNFAVTDATSANDTSNLSDSTIQTFQNALHFNPSSHRSNNGGTTTINKDPQIRPSNVQQTESIVKTNNQNNNYIRDDDSLQIRSPFEGISLKDFEKHQQLMKEANLEKRKLLSQAIEQR